MAMMLIYCVAFNANANPKSTEGNDDDFNAIEFTYKMFLMNNFDKVHKCAVENGFVSYYKKVKVDFIGAREKGRKVVLSMYRPSKKDTVLTKVQINLNTWSDDEIVKCLKELGFSESGSDFSVDNLTGETRPYRLFYDESGKHRAEFEEYSNTSGFGPETIRNVIFRWETEE